jgi:hypothetical protein
MFRVSGKRAAMPIARAVLSWAVVCLAAEHAGAAPVKPAAPLARMTEAAEKYARLHRDVQHRLPVLPKKAEAEAIAEHRRALARGIVEARGDARPGDVLVPEAQPLLRERLADALTQRPAAKRKEIATGNPANEGTTVALKVNAPYPEAAPWSSVPPLVLALLPRLPAEVEYRFVGDDLVLLDVEANLIVDFMRGAAQPAAQNYKP